jgi:LacI family transcriptional regulator
MIETRDRLGGREAAAHLAELGHKKIAFVSGPATFRSSHERRSGFEEALNERGLSLAKAYVAEGAYTYDSGIEAGRALLSMADRPTAIFAGNDEMAAGVLQAARQLAVRVPEDVSVVGFDDFQIASRLWPTLTTVRTPTREIGRLAVERLMGREDDTRDPKSRLPSLVVRESTAAPPA